MTLKNELESRVRGWFPKDPQLRSPVSINLETNPLKLKRNPRKSAINIAQVVAVALSVCLILGGLYLNSISNTKTENNLPVYYESLEAPVEYNGVTYNCSIKLFTSPPLRSDFFGGAARETRPLRVYLNEPSNITSGEYEVKLQYIAYNDRTEAYVPRVSVSNSTFTVDPDKQGDLIAYTHYLKAPFDDGSDQIIRNIVFTFYTNKTGQLPNPLFTLTTPIDLTQGSFPVTYPYETVGTALLAVGIASLIMALVISFVSLGTKTGGYENIQTSRREANA